MPKPILLLLAFAYTLVSYSQTRDSLILFYKSDQFTISKPDKARLDSFLVKNWDRIFIKGYTDETDEEDYNLDLSRKRAGEVKNYFLSKKIDSAVLSSQYFGEALAIADNNSEEGRALNRRTVVIGYQYPRVKAKPIVDPMKPVTTTLDNGFIITYQPGNLSEALANSFGSGSGSPFSVITNTREMLQNNLYNNTTNGEILSSVLIICNNGYNPCKLDSPVLIKVPIPYKTKCPIEKVKFFNAVAENGKRIWQEQSKELFPEEIDGRQYISIWMDDLCGCINFDFKIEPDCFDTDSTKIQYVNTNIKNLLAEIRGLNSVYMPKKISNATHQVLFLKDKINDALISFSLYNGKKRIRTFRDQPIASFPFDKLKGTYVLDTGSYKFYFPKQKIWEVVLKVNGDKYKGYSEKNKFDFIYLNRSNENILVDFTIRGPGNKLTEYKNQPIASLPFDPITGYHVIDKKFLKEKKQAGAISMK